MFVNQGRLIRLLLPYFVSSAVVLRVLPCLYKVLSALCCVNMLACQNLGMPIFCCVDQWSVSFVCFPNLQMPL